MRRIIAALMLVLAAESRAGAQVVFGPVGYTNYYSFNRFGWGWRGPGFAYGGFYRSWNVTPVPVWGPVAVGPWGTFGGVSVTPFAGPGWGWGGPPIVQQPIIVVQAAPQPGGFAQAGGFNRFRPDNAPDLPVNVPDVPARPKGDFLVVKPQPPGVGRIPAKEPERRPDQGNIFTGKPAGGGFAGAFDGVPKDPKTLAVFNVRVAREAFATEQYGRAAERLQDAAAATPDDPVPYFLLAQARTATGDYAGAVAAIRDGLKRDPDWPATTFRLREIYGLFPNRFDGHLAELRDALAANPDDPTLTFLLGYQLWFLGNKEDAAKLFRRAAERAKNPGIAERFLLEFDGKKA